MLAGDQKWGALRSCEAFILPSHQENFGVAVAEALACGKEVLITNKVNIWREVEQSGVGFVAEDTEQGIVSLLEKFLERNKTQMSDNSHARQVFLSEFALATSTRRLVEVFGS
jgi:glycosyltransferase involved in cell wall biosynthesis